MTHPRPGSAAPSRSRAVGAWARGLLAAMMCHGTPADCLESGAMGTLTLAPTTTLRSAHQQELAATFSRGTQKLRFWGFYDGERAGRPVFRVRYNLPSPGDWGWETTAAGTAGLHGIRGRVVVTPASADTPGPIVRDGRAIVHANTGTPFLFKGHTAWGLMDTAVDATRTLAWCRSQGFDLIRFDLRWKQLLSRDLDRARLEGWHHLESVVAKAAAHGMRSVVEVKLLDIQARRRWSATLRQRYIRSIAARLGADPRIAVYVLSTEDTIANGAVIDAIGQEFSDAFHRPPLLAVHTYRNGLYFPPTSPSIHPVVRWARFQDDYRGRRWLTMGLFHQAFWVDGWGILEHRRHPEFRDLPLAVGEGAYEGRDASIDVRAVPATFETLPAVAAALRHDPARYYRWLTLGTLLSGGSGVVYGLGGEDRDCAGCRHAARWWRGHPDGGAAEGHRQMGSIIRFLEGQGLDPRGLVPADHKVATERAAGGLDRAKYAELANGDRAFVWNPFPGDVQLRGIPGGLRVTYYDPVAGTTHPGTPTAGDGRLPGPTAFTGEWVAVLARDPSPVSAEAPAPPTRRRRSSP